MRVALPCSCCPWCCFCEGHLMPPPPRGQRGGGGGSCHWLPHCPLVLPLWLQERAIAERQAQRAAATSQAASATAPEVWAVCWRRKGQLWLKLIGSEEGLTPQTPSTCRLPLVALVWLRAPGLVCGNSRNKDPRTEARGGGGGWGRRGGRLHREIWCPPFHMPCTPAGHHPPPPRLLTCHRSPPHRRLPKPS